MCFQVFETKRFQHTGSSCCVQLAHRLTERAGRPEIKEQIVAVRAGLDVQGIAASQLRENGSLVLGVQAHKEGFELKALLSFFTIKA